MVANHLTLFCHTHSQLDICLRTMPLYENNTDEKCRDAAHYQNHEELPSVLPCHGRNGGLVDELFIHWRDDPNS